MSRKPSMLLHNILYQLVADKITLLEYYRQVTEPQKNSSMYNGANETCLVIVNGGGNENTENTRYSVGNMVAGHEERGHIFIPSQSYLDGLCPVSEVEDIISKIVSDTDINCTELGEFFNQCQLCPAVFATKTQLSKHIQQHCGTDNTDMCQSINTEEREKSFNSATKVVIKNVVNNLHQFHYETGVKLSDNTRTCNICEKSFNSIKRFETHVKKHFTTPIPTKMKPKQDRIFQCNSCDKVFNSKVSIRKHVIVHLSKTKKQLYTCNICGKEYISLVARESHKLKHDPYYEFSCEFCPKKFKLKKLLKEHIRIHTRKSNYSQRHNYCCSICDVKFTLKEDLEFHKEMAHKHDAGGNCNINIDEYVAVINYNAANEFLSGNLNENEFIKVEIDEDNYNAQLSTDDLKEIEEDIMKVEAEDINSDEIDALNMDDFCDEIYLNNEEC